MRTIWGWTMSMVMAWAIISAICFGVAYVWAFIKNELYRRKYLANDYYDAYGNYLPRIWNPMVLWLNFFMMTITKD